MKLNLVTLLFVFVLVGMFAVHAKSIEWTAWHIAGALIAAPALLLLIVARLQLGGAFSVEAKATSLVTTGLYAKMRNPIYYFGAFLILGFVVWTGNLWFLLAFLVLIPMQIIRGRAEARVLEEKFGAAYVEYRKRTWF